jgi:hypothetical protein
MNNTLSDRSGPAEHRHGTRTHLFVIATMCWDAGTTPVHVRNMSVKGALIEAAVLPEPGSLVLLKRGRLEVRGRVAWAAARQAGLAFGATISVADWMARQANSRQDQIDEIVSALKSGAIGEVRPVSPASGSHRPQSIEEELSLLRADLVQLGNGLAADIVLVATHPEIQLLDIAQQRIDRIMNAIAEAAPCSL